MIPAGRPPAGLVAAGGRVSVQVLNEFVSVLRRKWAWNWSDTEAALAEVRALVGRPVPVSIELHEAAVALARDHNFNIYDALIVAAAQRARCPLLLSEDMADGMTIGGVTIRNPFRTA